METSPVPVPPIQPGRVLVVDDDARSRQLLKDLLTSRGYLVAEAVNGEDALAAVLREPPDVILLDVVLPKVGGFEVCRRLKSDPATSSICILLITCLTEREHRMKGIQCGADDFLLKPVDVDDVLLRVRNAVTAKQVMDELQLRRGRETFDDALLRQLGNLSATNPGLDLALLSVGAKMLYWRSAANRFDESDRRRLSAVSRQINVALA